MSNKEEFDAFISSNFVWDEEEKHLKHNIYGDDIIIYSETLKRPSLETDIQIDIEVSGAQNLVLLSLSSDFISVQHLKDIVTLYIKTVEALFEVTDG